MASQLPVHSHSPLLTPSFASPPLTRGSSPSPSVSPTPALLACPPLDRCFSTNSTASDFSGRSSGSRSSTGSSGLSRRRGYVRPQGASFADSAKNRDSVMSLGSIAHLQYYFARTGMLDGKGAQLAREDTLKSKRGSTGTRVSIITTDPSSQQQYSDLDSPTRLVVGGEGDLVGSPTEDFDPTTLNWEGEDESFMLPPTVSTYSHRTQFIPPPPDVETLRRELRESLGHVSKALADVRAEQETTLPSEPSPNNCSTIPEEGDCDGDGTTGTATAAPTTRPRSPNQGWHEIQGMHMLDVTTMGIKAAKEYYTMHEHPQRLSKVKSERQIREELLAVMDTLKRMAARNFAGGMRRDELAAIGGWVHSVEDFLAQEKRVEEQEARDRASWCWLEGDWAEGDLRREWEFLKTFVEDTNTLPAWEPISPSSAEGELPTPFLSTLRSGLLLCKAHNRILQQSRNLRSYGEIKGFHTDTSLPYRAADNLRFWIKAAEIRWDLKLQGVDVMGVVYARGGRGVWEGFEAAVKEWCKTVREEVTREWKVGGLLLSSSAGGGERDVERDGDGDREETTSTNTITF